MFSVGSAPRLCDSTDRVQFSERVSAVQCSAVQLITVQCTQLIGKQSVRELLQFCRCEPLPLYAGS
jgi:hypothetical protein